MKIVNILHLLLSTQLAFAEPSFLKVDPSKIPTKYRSLDTINIITRDVSHTTISSEYQSEIQISILENSEIEMLFDYFKQRLPLHYVDNCCQDRAQMMSFAAFKNQIFLPKIFVEGALFLSSKNIKWGFHVAPVTYNEYGELIVIDPSVSDYPLLVDQWLPLFSVPSDSVTFADASSYVPSDAKQNYSGFKSDDNELAELNLLGCESVQN